MSTEPRIGLDDRQRGLARGDQHAHALAREAGEAQARHARLLGPEQLARAAQLEVLLGDDEAVVALGQHLQARARVGVGLAAGVQQAQRVAGRAPDTTAQLMQLGQPEALGVLDQDHPGVGDVDTDLDHRGRDQDPQLARSKALHHRVLVLRDHAAVDDPDRLLGHQLGQRGRGRLDVGCVDRLAGLDQRTDHVGLVASPDPLDQALAGSQQRPRAREHASDRRDPTRRQLVDDRHVELAKGREREAPRDRRGGHDQQVGRAALLAQGPALLDAEAMLLVDHDQREPSEFDVLDQERVRADEQIDLPRGQQREHAVALGLAGRAGQQRDPNAGPLRPGRHGPHVLLGEDLGRSHDRRLRARVDHRERDREGERGLARADVTLQQAQHRLGSGEVTLDLVEHPPLGAGRLEGQASAQALAIEAALDQRRHHARQRAIDPTLAKQRELQEEEFVEGQSTVRDAVTSDQQLELIDRQIVGRLVQQAERVADRGQAVRADQLARQRVVVAELAQLGDRGSTQPN